MLQITRVELIKEVGADVGIARTKVAPIIDSVFKVIAETVASGETVRIINFGKFEPVIRKSRPGRNPMTKVEVVIPERRIAKFTQGKELGEMMSQK